MKKRRSGTFCIYRKAFGLFLFLMNIFIGAQVYNVNSITTISKGTLLYISDSTVINEQRPLIYISKNTIVYGWDNKKNEELVFLTDKAVPPKKSVLADNAVKKEIKKIISKAKSAYYIAAFSQMVNQRFEPDLALKYQTAIIPVAYNVQKLFTEGSNEIFWNKYLSFTTKKHKSPYNDTKPVSGILNLYRSRPPPYVI